MNDFVYTRGCESAQRKLVEYYRFSLRRFFYRACLNTIVNTVLVNTARETFEYHTFAFRKFLFGREREGFEIYFSRMNRVSFSRFITDLLSR